MSKTKRLVISLPIETHQFVVNTAKGNQSFVVKEALEIYRLFGGNISEAQLARQALAYLQQTYPNWEELIKGE